MKEFKIYIHRDSEGKIFYVGCTKNKYRPYVKYSINSGRSKEWFERCNNIFTVEIIADNLTEELAYELEEFMISEYGRQCDGGILVNKSTGGKYSGNGVIPSTERRLKISNSHKGKKLSDEHKIKLSEIKQGSKNNRYGIIRGQHQNAKKVICTVTGKIWNCAKDCADENNINYYTLIGKLNGNRKNNTTFMYQG